MNLARISVELIDNLGSDLTVVNAARVSFDKHHDALDKSDEGLIRYLAAHGHWTPFSHPQIQLRITAPIFVARQAFKHKVGLTENEISRRYVDSEPSFYIPGNWRARAENKKQGSGGAVSAEDNSAAAIECIKHYYNCLEIYNNMLERGVCPEQARVVLPQSMITSWYWTGSLFAFARVCNLRNSPDAQEEIQELARQIEEAVKNLYPLSWGELTKKEKLKC